MNNIVEIKGLEKNYPKFKLGPLNLSIPHGVIVGYIGENGSGKTTTIKLILDMIKADKGEIRIFGEKLSNNPKAIKEKIGVVFDDLHLPEQLKIKEVNNMCKKIYENWDSNVFCYYLDKFELDSNKKISELSRGMKMKVSISIALSHKAELLLLDEATSGLDPLVREDILDILMEFIQNERCSVLVSSHILSDLEKTADYIAFIHKGKLIFMESKDELRDEYVILSLDRKSLESINNNLIISKRKNEFGERILMRREYVPREFLDICERPSIEDIMIFFIKGGKQ